MPPQYPARQDDENMPPSRTLWAGGGRVHNGVEQAIFGTPPHDPRVSLPDYLSNPDRYPYVGWQPQEPVPYRAMVRAPQALAQFFAAPSEPQLSAPLPIANSEMTAPGVDVSALVTPPPDMSDPRQAPLPPGHGLEPPDASQVAPAASAGIGYPPMLPHAMHRPHPLMAAVRAAQAETMERRGFAERFAADQARHERETQQNMQLGGPIADAARPSPFSPDTIHNILAAIVRYSQEQALHIKAMLKALRQHVTKSSFFSAQRM